MKKANYTHYLLKLTKVMTSFSARYLTIYTVAFKQNRILLDEGELKNNETHGLYSFKFLRDPISAIENRKFMPKVLTILSAGDGPPALIELFHQLDDVPDHLRIALDIGLGKMPDHE